MSNEDREQWHLPPNLRITNPKVMEEAEQMRKELSQRLNSPFAHLSPTEYMQRRALSRLPNLSFALQEIERERRENRGRQTARQLDEAELALKARMAESYAILGRFDVAALIHPDPAYRADYAKHVQTTVPHETRYP